MTSIQPLYKLLFYFLARLCVWYKSILFFRFNFCSHAVYFFLLPV
jgi:hypothetical protein